MRKYQPLLALAALLFLMGFGMANSPSMTTKSVLPVAKVVDCCDDPACYPACCPECPPDCAASKVAKKTACCDCPPCPFCP